MIVTAVVCPHPPALLRELGGAEDAVPLLRAACHQALGAALAAAPDAVAVVGGADRTRQWDPTLPLGLRRFGTTHARDAVCLPPSLVVARRLLEEAGWSGRCAMHSVARDLGPAGARRLAEALGARDGRVALLVMADGSARRGEKAPGHLDPRAVGFDDRIGRALAEGDAQALRALDPGLAEELLAAGRAALTVLGEVALVQGSTVRAEVTYRDDPYGVMYTVASWHLR